MQGFIHLFSITVLCFLLVLQVLFSTGNKQPHRAGFFPAAVHVYEQLPKEAFVGHQMGLPWAQ